MAAPEPLLIANQLARVYEKGPSRVHALRGVDLEIESGEFVAIMGPSGSGKSTLMHILGCLDRPSSGTYFLDGRDVSRLRDRELSRLRATRIGFVFQTFNLIHQCDVLENVELPFLYQTVRGREIRRRAREAVDRVGLGPRAHHRPAELSGGEMQRAAIARAIVVAPLLILADEPTGNLDTQTSEEILKLFRDLNRGGATLAVVTHDREVAGRADRIISLRDGALDNSTDRAR